jgi:hypothetical protein
MDSITAAVPHDRIRRLEGDAEFCKGASGERVANAEQAQQDMLVLHGLLAGVVERVDKRHLQTRRDAPDPRRSRLEHPRASLLEGAPRPNVSSSRPRTASRSIPSVARASASIRGAHTPAKKAESLMSVRYTQLAENPRRAALRIAGER